MTTYPALNLPRFSGSTLEPTVEPIAIIPTALNLKRLSSSSTSSATANFSAMYLQSSPSLSSVDSSSVDDDEFLLPPPPNFSLNRPNRPTFIDIPESCKTFTVKDAHDYENWSSYDPQERGCQTEPEFEWDENTQTVYKRSHHPDPSRHIFWSA